MPSPVTYHPSILQMHHAQDKIRQLSSKTINCIIFSFSSRVVFLLSVSSVCSWIAVHILPRFLYDFCFSWLSALPPRQRIFHTQHGSPGTCPGISRLVRTAAALFVQTASAVILSWLRSFAPCRAVCRYKWNILPFRHSQCSVFPVGKCFFNQLFIGADQRPRLCCRSALLSGICTRRRFLRSYLVRFFCYRPLEEAVTRMLSAVLAGRLLLRCGFIRYLFHGV